MFGVSGWVIWWFDVDEVCDLCVIVSLKFIFFSQPPNSYCGERGHPGMSHAKPHISHITHTLHFTNYHFTSQFTFYISHSPHSLQHIPPSHSPSQSSAPIAKPENKFEIVSPERLWAVTSVLFLGEIIPILLQCTIQDASVGDNEWGGYSFGQILSKLMLKLGTGERFNQGLGVSVSV